MLDLVALGAAAREERERDGNVAPVDQPEPLPVERVKELAQRPPDLLSEKGDVAAADAAAARAPAPCCCCSSSSRCSLAAARTVREMSSALRSRRPLTPLTKLTKSHAMAVKRQLGSSPDSLPCSAACAAPPPEAMVNSYATLAPVTKVMATSSASASAALA